MGRVVVLKLVAEALEGPVGSGVLRVASLGIEVVVVTLAGRPGRYPAPDTRPRLKEPFLTGDLVLLDSLY